MNLFSEGEDVRELLQRQWADIFLQKNKGGRGILNLFQRTGKIKTSINILNSLPVEGRVLISYPDNKVKGSWELDFQKFGYRNTNLVFTNNSSLSKYIDEDFYMWIVDEIHTLSDKQLEYAEKIASNCKYVLGLSGTISRDTETLLSAQLGMDILARYGAEEAIRDGLVSSYNIYVHTVQLDTVKKEKNKKGILKSEKQRYDDYTFVIEKLKREKKDFMFLALQRNRILQNSYAKQLKVMNLLKGMKDKRVLVFTGLQKVAESLKIPFYHSKSKDDTVFQSFMNEEVQHMALANIGGVGTSFPNLDAIIMSTFTYNNERSGQLMARSLIKDYEGKCASIHILTSSEPEELKKLRETLQDFNKERIIYI